MGLTGLKSLYAHSCVSYMLHLSVHLLCSRFWGSFSFSFYTAQVRLGTVANVGLEKSH